MISLLPLVLIFALFYFLLIRPQQRRSKQHKSMLSEIKIGDEVASNGGLLGRVTDVDENRVTLKVASGVNVQVQKHAIAQMIPKGIFKDTDGGGKKSKGSRKQAEGVAQDLSDQAVESELDDEVVDATFEDPKKPG